MVERFKTEIEAELKRWGQDLSGEAEDDLLASNPGDNIRVSLDNGTIIANARDNIKLNRVNKSKPSDNLKLNISLRWVDPIDWGEDGFDGALCAACYKINGGNRADFETVQQDTEWDQTEIRYADDQFNNAPAIFYIPVESAEEFRDATGILQDHFLENASAWGVDPAEIAED
jgi:hypothetical protein